MSIPASLSHSARPCAPRGVVATLVVALAALLAAVGLGAPSWAAPNTGIAISIAELQKADANGIVQGGFVRVGEVTKLSFTWDASQTVLAEGDSFSIELGSSFTMRTTAADDLTVIYNGQSVSIGTCEFATTALTCTFNSEVTRLQDEGFTGFKGGGEFLMMATAVEPDETTTMKVNGVDTEVDLPGTGGIRAPRVPTYTPAKLGKSSTPINASTTTMPWSVVFGTEELQDKVAGFVADGTTVSTLVLTDTIGPGQSFVENLSSWALVQTTSSTSTTRVPLVNAAGRVYNTAGQSFTYTVSFNQDKSVATLTITGVFQPETNYAVGIPAAINAGTAQEGVIYRNSVAISGSDLSASGERYYNDTDKVTVTMEQGFGSFEIAKLIDGEAIDAVPAGTTFDVEVHYTLPNVASSYPSWQAPGTLSSDGRTGTVTLQVASGKTTAYEGTFPANTVITLSEDPSTASVADPLSIVWGTATFTIGGQETPTFTVASQASRAVTLTNTADYAGTLAVSKTVTGLADDVTVPTYAFSYTCGEVTGTIEDVPGDGTVVSATPSEAIPEGTTCTVTEQTDAAAVDGYELAEPAPVEVTLARSTAGPTVAEFTNTYTPVAAPTPGPSGTPTAEPTVSPTATGQPTATASASPIPARPRPTLARTGASVLVPVLVALAAVGGGALLVVRRRKR